MSSKAKKKPSHQHKPARATAPEPEGASSQPSAKMGKRKRILLIGVAIFCLVIFSVTGPMMSAFASLVGAGPQDQATMVVPDGDEVTISGEDWLTARNWASVESTVLFSGLADRELNEESILSYAVLRELADELEIGITDERIRQQIQLQMQFMRVTTYDEYLARLRQRSRTGYERLLRECLRVEVVRELLASSAVSTTQQALEAWAEENEEIRFHYLQWKGEDFVDAAAALEPSEEELQTFFDEGLSPQQRRDLENEEAASFEALALSAEALETEAVQSWAPELEPTEDDLDGFFRIQRFTSYRQEDGSPMSREQIGEERLARDYRLYQLMESLAEELDGVEDLQAFADERGLERILAEEMVVLSQLQDFPRLGSPRLEQVVRGTVDEWLTLPILGEDLAYLVRPKQIQERTLPELAEVRDSVVDYWREKRQAELAEEGAEAFVDGLPREEGAAEEDPVVLEMEAFQEQATQAEQSLNLVDWIGRRPRPADPKFSTDQQVIPFLRGQVGQNLGDLEDGQILGPFQHPQSQSWLVVRLESRRPVDKEKIWPSELTIAQSYGRTAASNKLREELSFQGLSTAYQVKPFFLTEPDGEDGGGDEEEAEATSNP